ncbi:peptidoglycan-binding domain-containing protein [Streptomyces sp. NPDC050619]|uniref:peptidoglycan-binding domain-containing protein n=1 Tax=Streptomyces sp. NPDC050619 TaxID=3157214 RepID=UPI0034227E78
MTEPTGHRCPECGAPRGADNSPSCGCTQRASDALRDARTAEAAAAEDFDPLRIRPYVELAGAREGDDDGAEVEGEVDDTGAGVGQVSGTPGTPDAPPVEETMLLRAVDPGAARTASGSGSGSGSAGARGASLDADADATAPLPVLDAGATTALPAVGADTASVLPTPLVPTPLVPPPTAPSSTDLRLFEAADGIGPAVPGSAGPSGDDDERPRRRRRSTVLLAVSGSVVAVVAAAGFASGLFAYETPSREGAPPEAVRAAVPDASTSEASVSASPQTPSAPPTSAAPSPSASTSRSPSASPSASASSASPTPTRSAEPTRTPTSSAPGGSDSGGGSAEGSEGNSRSGSVLRRGDEGPEVTELQQRLNEVYLYNGDVDGDFTSEVEEALRNYQWSRSVGTDNLGVYDKETRAKLESETSEP